MARFLVHGLTVETASTLGWDPGAELLAGFPGAPVRSAAADLVIQVTAGRVEAPDPSLPADVILLQASVRAVLAATEVRVEAPGFLARVPLAGGLVEAVVYDGADRHELVHVQLFPALAAALRLRGWYHLHAACTVAPDGAPLLIVGHGGSGKTTLCSALVAAGHRYLGDDVLFLEGATSRLLAFARPFHLGPEAAGALSATAPHLGERYGAGPKRALDAAAAWPGRAEWSASVPGALLFPRVAAGAPATSVEPMPVVEAAAALIESSAFAAARLPGHRAHLAALAALADSAPACRVALGADLLADAADTVQRLLAAL